MIVIVMIMILKAEMTILARTKAKIDLLHKRRGNQNQEVKAITEVVVINADIKMIAVVLATHQMKAKKLNPITNAIKATVKRNQQQRKIIATLVTITTVTKTLVRSHLNQKVVVIMVIEEDPTTIRVTAKLKNPSQNLETEAMKGETMTINIEQLPRTELQVVART